MYVAEIRVISKRLLCTSFLDKPIPVFGFCWNRWETMPLSFLDPFRFKRDLSSTLLVSLESRLCDWILWPFDLCEV